MNYQKKELIQLKYLDNLIQEKIQKTKEEIIKYNETIEINSVENNSSLNLLKEKYEKSKYKKEDYPDYEFFYYSDYLNEKYIKRIKY